MKDCQENSGWFTSLLWAVLVALYLWGLSQRSPVAVVQQSWTKKECVKVEPPEAGTCDQLPEKYEVVWVR